MHNAYIVTPINYWWNYAEGIEWPWNIGSDVRFQDHSLEVSLLSFQSSFSKAWYLEYSMCNTLGTYSMLDFFLGDAFGVLSCSYRSYCSAVWCFAVDTHLKPLVWVVSGACFLTGSVFVLDIACCQSVEVLCTRCIRSGVIWCIVFMFIMPYLYHMCHSGLDAVLWLYCTSVYICTSSLQSLTEPQDFHCILSVFVEWSCWPCLQWCGTGRFQEHGQCLPIGLSLSSISIFYWFPFLFYLYIGWYCGAGVFGLIRSKLLSHSLALLTFLKNNNNRTKEANDKCKPN